MFDANGSVIPLGKYLSSDSAGASLFPTMAASDAAVRAISDSQNFRLNLGSLLTRVDADVRRFPLQLSYGLSSRLTVSATLPIVVTRVNAAVTLDSSGNAGWNQADAFSSGNFNGLSQIALLINGLEAGASIVDAQIAAGSFSCAGATTATAQDLVNRVRFLRMNLIALTGVTGTGTTVTPLPPAAPTASSAIGAAIESKIAGIRSELSCYTATSIPDLLLPPAPFKSSDVSRILNTAAFVCQATIRAYSMHAFMGDMEL